MRILTWNLERRKPGAPYGKLASRHLFSQSPDIMAISETRTNFPKSGGYTVWAEHPKGHFAQDERKILIWSKNPWLEIDSIGDERLPGGRFISAVTDTRLGQVRVVGVCIPYHMADVTHGTQDKKPWEQHFVFLDILPEILKTYTRPIIIAGDYNQRYPRVKYGNRAASEKMAVTFKDYNIVTQGVISGMDRAGIDHIALGAGLSLKSVWGWPHEVNGTRLSDHDAGCEVG